MCTLCSKAANMLDLQIFRGMVLLQGLGEAVSNVTMKER